MNQILTKLHPQYIKDKQGTDTFVVLPKKEYEELLKDLADLASIAERRNEQTISLETFESNLKNDGLI